MNTPAEPSQDVVMAQIYGISVEDYKASIEHRELTMKAITYGAIEVGIQALKNWRSFRPGFKTLTT